MSEPGAGTDVKAMKTKAVRMDEELCIVHHGVIMYLDYYHLKSSQV